MTPEQLAWAAGFFDGEGYITIPERLVISKTNKQYKSHYIRLGINHVDPRPLQKFQQLFGGILVYSDKIIGNRKPRWQWKLSCNQAKQFLIQLRPYLINKDIVADIVLQFLETISPNKKELSTEIVEFRRDCAARLKLINSQT